MEPIRHTTCFGCPQGTRWASEPIFGGGKVRREKFRQAACQWPLSVGGLSHKLWCCLGQDPSSLRHIQLVTCENLGHGRIVDVRIVDGRIWDMGALRPMRPMRLRIHCMVLIISQSPIEFVQVVFQKLSFQKTSQMFQKTHPARSAKKQF